MTLNKTELEKSKVPKEKYSKNYLFRIPTSSRTAVTNIMIANELHKLRKLLETKKNF